LLAFGLEIVYLFYRYLFTNGMKTTTPIIPTLDQARTDLSLTIGKLLSAFKAATIEARDYARIKNDSDESFFSHQVRYLARIQLGEDGIDAAEECELENTPNTGICLTQPNYLMRVLRDTHGGSLPPAGDSERRKRFFAQQSEQLRLELEPRAEDCQGADERKPVHIVFLWGTTQERQFTGLWVICPNGEENATHFQEFFPVPELGDLGLFDAPRPEELPPCDLGFTKRREHEPSLDKTGTESSE
jgi:hypothetical protein